MIPTSVSVVSKCQARWFVCGNYIRDPRSRVFVEVKRMEFFPAAKQIEFMTAQGDRFRLGELEMTDYQK